MSGEPGWERVDLYSDDGPAWRRVSPRLVAVRSVVAVVTALLAGLGLAAAAALLGRSPLWGAGAAALGLLWVLWLVRRQVASISYAEQAEELVIRKGRMWRSLVSVPYGRLQFADMQSGPLMRRFGLASVQIHTASPRSGGVIPGLRLEEAQALRARLTERGESQRAGL